MKSSLSLVKCLLLFTRFCGDQIPSRDELIPVKKHSKHPLPHKKKIILVEGEGEGGSRNFDIKIKIV